MCVASARITVQRTRTSATGHHLPLALGHAERDCCSRTAPDAKLSLAAVLNSSQPSTVARRPPMPAAEPRSVSTFLRGVAFGGFIVACFLGPDWLAVQLSQPAPWGISTRAGTPVRGTSDSGKRGVRLLPPQPMAAALAARHDGKILRAKSPRRDATRWTCTRRGIIMPGSEGVSTFLSTPPKAFSLPL